MQISLRSCGGVGLTAGRLLRSRARQCMRSHPDSNRNYKLRRLAFYPLNYESLLSRSSFIYSRNKDYCLMFASLRRLMTFLLMIWFLTTGR